MVVASSSKSVKIQEEKLRVHCGRTRVNYINKMLYKQMLSPQLIKLKFLQFVLRIFGMTMMVMTLCLLQRGPKERTLIK